MVMGDLVTEVDVAVLGGGPGGYSAAFRCAELGLETVVVEATARLGGACLFEGCIPSKALLHVAAVKHEVEGAREAGLDEGEQLRKIRFKRAVVATGSAAESLPGIPIGGRVMDSTAALELADVPARLL